MKKISDYIKLLPDKLDGFEFYELNSLEHGKVFSEASMGFLAGVDYGLRGDQITVKVETTKPVLATLGCQLAGWIIGDAMLSGPLRARVRKPEFIFDKIKHVKIPKLPDVVCVEGVFEREDLVDKLRAEGIDSAQILYTENNSKTQFVNILARTIEIALFRLSFLTDLSDIKISEALGTVTTSIEKEDLNVELNDSIRYNSAVTLIGDFGGFREFEPIVTSHSGFADQTFKTILAERGSIARCPIEVFSVSRLTVIDNGKTRAYS